jgi:hypothetical protein
MTGIAHPANQPNSPPWEEQIPVDEWAVYQRAMAAARAHGVGFAFGGAFALAVYTGRLRNTKDFDFYIMPSDRPAMLQAMAAAGLTDYFERQQYDRSWIYRASQDDVIVDTIWAMANHRAEVDERWLSRGPDIMLRGERLRAIPVEELIWSKLYVLQKDRCDWGDVVNLLDAQAEVVDWEHLLDRLGQDGSLFAGALRVFGWLAPDRVDAVPAQVWDRLELRRPERMSDPELPALRARLLDSRPWFTRLGG